MNGDEMRLAVKFTILALLLFSAAFSTVSFATSSSQLIDQIRELYLQLAKISE
jgi:hypothetical protein